METTTLTIESKVVTEGKQKIYKILKMKSFDIEKNIGEIEKELEKRLNVHLNDLLVKLKEIKFENPETSTKVLIMRLMIKILNEICDEYKIKLNEKDLTNLEEMTQDL